MNEKKKNIFSMHSPKRAMVIAQGGGGAFRVYMRALLCF